MKCCCFICFLNVTLMQLRISKIVCFSNQFCYAVNLFSSLICYKTSNNSKYGEETVLADEITDVCVMFMFKHTIRCILHVIATVESCGLDTAIIFDITIEYSSSCDMVGRKFLSCIFVCAFFFYPKSPAKSIM